MLRLKVFLTLIEKMKFGLTDTKTHYVREVVIPKQLMVKLREFSEMN